MITGRRAFYLPLNHFWRLIYTNSCCSRRCFAMHQADCAPSGVLFIHERVVKRCGRLCVCAIIKVVTIFIVIIWIRENSSYWVVECGLGERTHAGERPSVRLFVAVSAATLSRHTGLTPREPTGFPEAGSALAWSVKCAICLESTLRID